MTTDVGAARFGQLSGHGKLRLSVGLLVASVMAWIFIIWQAPSMDMAVSSLSGALNFTGVWAVMMGAMMFPSVLPAVLLFAAASQSRIAYGVRPTHTWFFVLGYLLPWIGFGALAYGLNELLRVSLDLSVTQGKLTALSSGGALVLAGLFQFSTWKMTCLQHCRSPLVFLMHRWRDGLLGAIRMGFTHGTFCTGCCWGLMVVMVGLGVMNPVWMGVVAAVVYVEKTSRFGLPFSRMVGIALIIVGCLTAGGVLAPGSSPMVGMLSY